MKPLIMLTGKNGQVGRELLRLLPQVGEVVALGRDQLDLSNPTDICRTIRQVRPHLIVNAAAYTSVDQAETDETTAQAVNAEAPAVLADEAKRLGSVLVHYSTDYVFDGWKRSPYIETDETNPLNVYGKTKLAGELAIRASDAFHLIFRTAWVYSHRGRNFLLTILRLATEREELSIVRDQIGAPTCANDIAVATTKILAGIYRQDKGQPLISSISGTYHMTAAGEASWYNFAKAILEKAASASADVPWFVAATRGRPLIAKRILPIPSEEFQRRTRRPMYSVLSNSRLSQIFHITLPIWTTQLECCFATENVDDAVLKGASVPGGWSSASNS
jgi:dTDP-4-dehydrorhamnose reductase